MLLTAPLLRLFVGFPEVVDRLLKVISCLQ
jgi:hypothetical protein